MCAAPGLAATLLTGPLAEPDLCHHPPAKHFLLRLHQSGKWGRATVRFSNPLITPQHANAPLSPTQNIALCKAAPGPRASRLAAPAPRPAQLVRLFEYEYTCCAPRRRRRFLRPRFAPRPVWAPRLGPGPAPPPPPRQTWALEAQRPRPRVAPRPHTRVDHARRESHGASRAPSRPDLALPGLAWPLQPERAGRRRGCSSRRAGAARPEGGRDSACPTPPRPALSSRLSHRRPRCEARPAHSRVNTRSCVPRTCEKPQSPPQTLLPAPRASVD